MLFFSFFHSSPPSPPPPLALTAERRITPSLGLDWWPEGNGPVETADRRCPMPIFISRREATPDPVALREKTRKREKNGNKKSVEAVIDYFFSHTRDILFHSEFKKCNGTTTKGEKKPILLDHPLLTEEIDFWECFSWLQLKKKSNNETKCCFDIAVCM